MPSLPLKSFVDDPSLSGANCFLLRRIAKEWIRSQPVNTGAPVEQEADSGVSGQAFQLQKLELAQEKGYPGRCMSFVLQEGMIIEDYLVFVRDIEKYAIGRIPADSIRELGFGLQRVPEPDEPRHVVAFFLGSGNGAKKAQTPLARLCELVRIPG